MKKLLVYLLISGLTINCVKSKVKKNPLVIETPDVLAAYVTGFQEEAKNWDVVPDYSNITVKFDTENKIKELMPDSPSTVGLCVVESGIKHDSGADFSVYEEKTIYIKESYFNSALEITKQELVYHEMSHCSLNRNHLNDLGPVGTYVDVPISVMNSYLVSSRQNLDVLVIDNWDYYMKELFLGRNAALLETTGGFSEKMGNNQIINSYIDNNGVKTDIYSRKVFE